MRTTSLPSVRLRAGFAALALVTLTLVALQPASPANAASTCAGFIPATISTPANLITAVTQAQGLNCPGTDVIDLNGNTITFTSAGGDTALPTITTPLSIINGTIARSSAAAFRFILVGATGDLDITNLTISDGLGPAAGDVGGGAILNRGSLDVTGVSFIRNSANAGGDGGAIRNEGTLVATESEIHSGSARAGGGIYNEGTATVLRSLIYDNDATAGAGGGIVSTGPVTIRESILFMNGSTTGGAGLELAAAAATTPAWTVANSTISDNAGAFGLHHDGGDLTLVNSILSGTVGGPDCGDAASPTVAAALSNLIQDDGCFAAGYQLNLDPQFEPPAGPYPSYRPSGTSPVLDVGTDDSGSITDLDGNTRVRGFGIDMGAYERPSQDITVQFASAVSSRAEGLPLDGLLVIATSDGHPTRVSVTVQIAVIGGTATAPDYAVTGAITIPAGVADTGTASLASGFSVVDDAMVEATETVELQLSAPTRATLGTQVTTTHSILNDDVAGFALGAPPTTLTEPNGTATFTMVATSEPAGLIRLNLASSDVTECTVSPVSLAFDAATWSIPQTVTVAAADDALADGTKSCTVTFTRDASSTAGDYPVGLVPAAIVIAVEDDDVSAPAGIDLASTGSAPLIGAGLVALTLAATGVTLTLALAGRRRHRHP